MCIQKGLLCRPWICPVEGSPACHTPHGKELQFLAFTAVLNLRLIPVNLPLDAPLITLWYTDISLDQAQLVLPLTDIPSDRALRHRMFWKLRT